MGGHNSGETLMGDVIGDHNSGETLMEDNTILGRF